MTEENDSTLRTEICDDTITVIDPAGGRWWPSEEASEEIAASGGPEAAASRICDTQPMRGEWRA